MFPNEADSSWAGRDVTVEVDINPLADVVALQIPAQFQSNVRDICESKSIAEHTRHTRQHTKTQEDSSKK
jgi:hypothetical protein